MLGYDSHQLINKPVASLLTNFFDPLGGGNGNAFSSTSSSSAHSTAHRYSVNPTLSFVHQRASCGGGSVYTPLAVNNSFINGANSAGGGGAAAAPVAVSSCNGSVTRKSYANEPRCAISGGGMKSNNGSFLSTPNSKQQQQQSDIKPIVPSFLVTHADDGEQKKTTTTKKCIKCERKQRELASLPRDRNIRDDFNLSGSATGYSPNQKCANYIENNQFGASSSSSSSPSSVSLPSTPQSTVKKSLLAKAMTNNAQTQQQQQHFVAMMCALEDESMQQQQQSQTSALGSMSLLSNDSSSSLSSPPPTSSSVSPPASTIGGVCDAAEAKQTTATTPTTVADSNLDESCANLDVSEFTVDAVAAVATGDADEDADMMTDGRSESLLCADCLAERLKLEQQQQQEKSSVAVKTTGGVKRVSLMLNESTSAAAAHPGDDDNDNDDDDDVEEVESKKFKSQITSTPAAAAAASAAAATASNLNDSTTVGTHTAAASQQYNSTNGKNSSSANRLMKQLMLSGSGKCPRTTTPHGQRGQQQQQQMPAEGGLFFGQCRHSDGSLIRVMYQSKLIKVAASSQQQQQQRVATKTHHRDSLSGSAASGSDELICVWISRDPHLNSNLLAVTEQLNCSTAAALNRTSALGNNKLNQTIANEPSTYANEYEDVRVLGRGASGFVELARRRVDKREVVTKYILKAKIHRDSWIEDERYGCVPLEVSILCKLEHSNIIRVIDVFHDAEHVQMVMEKHGTVGMDMFEFIDRKRRVYLPEPLSAYIYKQIVSAVAYLHARHLVHRDIKDENIVIDEHFHIKLIDFGSAAYYSHERRFATFCGTIDYCSPDVLLGNKYTGPELDAWTCGIALYTLVFSENPFLDAEETIECILRPPFKVSAALTRLLYAVICAKPEERATVQQLDADEWVNQPCDIADYKWDEWVVSGELKTQALQPGQLVDGGDDDDDHHHAVAASAADEDADRVASVNGKLNLDDEADTAAAAAATPATRDAMLVDDDACCDVMMMNANDENAQVLNTLVAGKRAQQTMQSALLSRSF